LGLFDAGPPAGLDEALLAPGRDAARRAAEAAVTLVRDDGVLPLRLKPDDVLALVVVRSSRYADEAASFASEIARRHPRTVFVDVPDMSPKPKAIDDAASRVRGASAVIVGTFQYGDLVLRGQNALLRRLELGPAPVIAVSLMAPYDIPVAAGARAALCVYGMTESSLAAAARVIFGEIPARGRLPVKLPDGA
jgi:beta-N-acetylhexosaminidase